MSVELVAAILMLIMVDIAPRTQKHIEKTEINKRDQIQEKKEIIVVKKYKLSDMGN